MYFYESHNLGLLPREDTAAGSYRPVTTIVNKPVVPDDTSPAVSRQIFNPKATILPRLNEQPQDTGLQRALDALQQVRRGGLSVTIARLRARPLEKQIDQYLKNAAGLESNRITTFDKLAIRLRNEFPKVGARGIMDGAEAIRKFDLYGAVRILLNFDGVRIPEDLLVESVDRIVQPGSVPGSRSGQKFAYSALIKTDPGKLPEPLKDLRRNIIDEGSTTVLTTFPNTPIISPPPPPAPENLLPTISPPPVSANVDEIEKSDIVNGEVPLFTEAAADIGGLPGLALLGLGIYIFASSAKREFGSKRKKRRG